MTRFPASLDPDGPGRSYWRWAMRVYEFERNELVLLEAACKAQDRVARLDAIVAADGMMIAGSTGQRVLHPGVGEARMQVGLIQRLLGQLQLPADVDEAGDHKILSLASARGQRAARARWGDGRRRGTAS